MFSTQLFRVQVLGVLIAFTIAAATWCLGYQRLGAAETDPVSEQRAWQEAQTMVVQGQHRCGIVEYTHYPNGPTYIIALLRLTGVQRVASARLLPLTLSALSVGFLSWVLLRRSASYELRAWFLLALAVFVYQPGIRDWQGALHEHSYAMSLSFLAIALSASLPPLRSWILFPLGFLCGWTGYDFLPAQLAALFTIRCLYYRDTASASIGRIVTLACLDTLKCASGVAAAILTHFLQLWGFFASFQSATRDLLGSAAARMGLEASAKINPEYELWLRRAAFLRLTPPRSALIAELFREFTLTRWTYPGALAATAAAGLALSVLRAVRGFRTWPFESRAAISRIGLHLVVIAMAIVASLAWIVLMPRHAMFHKHMLPRHFFVSLLLLAILPILSSSRTGDPPPPDPPARVLRSFMTYAVAPLLLVTLYLYALMFLS
jgi:hypothetical protein